MVRVVKKIEEGIRTEAIISTVVVLIWVLIALMGIMRALTLFFFIQEKNRGEGGGHTTSMNLHTTTPGPDGFYDVPLTAMPNTTMRNDAAEHADSQPAPRYETATKDGSSPSYGAAPASVLADYRYPDEKVGWRGE